MTCIQGCLKSAVTGLSNLKKDVVEHKKNYAGTTVLGATAVTSLGVAVLFGALAATFAYVKAGGRMPDKLPLNICPECTLEGLNSNLKLFSILSIQGLIMSAALFDLTKINHSLRKEKAEPTTTDAPQESKLTKKQITRIAFHTISAVASATLFAIGTFYLLQEASMMLRFFEFEYLLDPLVLTSSIVYCSILSLYGAGFIAPIVVAHKARKQRNELLKQPTTV